MDWMTQGLKRVPDAQEGLFPASGWVALGNPARQDVQRHGRGAARCDVGDACKG